MKVNNIWELGVKRTLTWEDILALAYMIDMGQYHCVTSDGRRTRSKGQHHFAADSLP